MSPEEQAELTKHLENVFSSVGSAIYALIYPASVMGNIEDVWKNAGRACAEFIVWTEN